MSTMSSETSLRRFLGMTDIDRSPRSQEPVHWREKEWWRASKMDKRFFIRVGERCWGHWSWAKNYEKAILNVEEEHLKECLHGKGNGEVEG